MDAPGLGLVVLFAVLACLISTVTALALAATARVRPGRGWGLPMVAWMVCAAIFAYADAQDVLWTPVNGDSGRPMMLAGLAEPPVHQGTIERKQAAGGMVEEGWGPQPASPPHAILSSPHLDAGGFEVTFCWYQSGPRTASRTQGSRSGPRRRPSPSVKVRPHTSCSP